MKYIIAAVLFISLSAEAGENRLGLSLLFQQDSTDNYLLSESDGQELYGVYIRPRINYRYASNIETFALAIQQSIERYNISDYNTESPAVAVNYQRVMERSMVSASYDRSIQSTLLSEFDDSGNVFKKSSSQTTETSKTSWNYQLNERDKFAINTSLQTTAYDSAAYSDLSNKGVQISLQHELTAAANIYAALSVNQYKSILNGEFPIAPQPVQDYLLCPPNSVLIAESSCFYLAKTGLSGENINTTTAKGAQLGGKWDIYDNLKLSFSAGATGSRVAQNIKMPISYVEFGAPIDQSVSFGGERTLYSDSKFTTADINITYQRESSTYSLIVTRKIQPSSNSGLWKTNAIEGRYHISFSEVDWLDVNLIYKDFLSLDKEIVTATATDRNIISGNIKYGYIFSNKLTATASLGYRQQESTFNRKVVANALQGVFTINYTPQEWVW